jgi:hypothetical protein
MNEIVLTSATFLPATNSTRITYAEETPGGARDGWKDHTIYHAHDATEAQRNEEVDAFIAEQNAKLQTI